MHVGLLGVKLFSLKPSEFLASFLLTKKKIKGIIITVRPKRKKCIMYCYDVCVSVWACVQCSWDVEVKTGWCPLTFASVKRDWVLPPASDTVGGARLRSPSPSRNIEACEPEATHYNLLLYQNQKYHVQQCNNATLCL